MAEEWNVEEDVEADSVETDWDEIDEEPVEEDTAEEDSHAETCGKRKVQCNGCYTWFCPQCDRGGICVSCHQLFCAHCLARETAGSICRHCSEQTCECCDQVYPPRGSRFADTKWVAPCEDCGILLCFECGYRYQHEAWLCEACYRTRLEEEQIDQLKTLVNKQWTDPEEWTDPDEWIEPEQVDSLSEAQRREILPNPCDLCNRGGRRELYSEMTLYPPWVMQQCQKCSAVVCPKHGYEVSGEVLCEDCYEQTTEGFQPDDFRTLWREERDHMEDELEEKGLGQQRTSEPDEEERINLVEMYRSSLCYLCLHKGSHIPGHRYCVQCGRHICKHHSTVTPTGGFTSAWICLPCARYNTAQEGIFRSDDNVLRVHMPGFGIVNSFINYRRQPGDPDPSEPIAPDEDHGFCDICKQWYGRRTDPLLWDELHTCPECGGTFCFEHVEDGLCMDCWNRTQPRYCDNPLYTETE